MIRFTLAGLLLWAVALPPPTTASTAITCAGTDDTDRLQGALDDAAEAGGGTVSISGRACVVSRDIRVGPGTHLTGDPMAVLTASDDGSFEQGILRCDGGGLRLTNLEIRVGAHDTTAISCALSEPTERVQLQHVRISLGGAPSQGIPASPAVLVECPKAEHRCFVADDLDVHCEAQHPSTHLGVRVAGPPTASGYVSRLVVRGCRQGLDATGVPMRIIDGDVSAPGPNAVAVRLPRLSTIRGAQIRVAGSDGVGIDVGPLSHVSGNTIQLTDAPRGRGIRVRGTTTLESNSVRAETGEGVVAFELLGGENVASNNASRLPREGSSTHYLIASSHNLLTGNRMTTGAWGARPPIFEGGSAGAFKNGARLTGNNMTHLRRGCAVLDTGWHANDNHCSWIGKGGAGFWVGSPGAFGSCSTHSLISGNTIHASDAGSALVRFASAARRCLPRKGSRAIPLLTACADPDADCGKEGLECKRATCANIAIDGNLFMAPVDGVTVVEMFQDVSNPLSLPYAKRIRVTNNALATHEATPLVAFREDQPEKLMSGMVIKGNTPESQQIVTGWKPSFGTLE